MGGVNNMQGNNAINNPIEKIIEHKQLIKDLQDFLKKQKKKEIPPKLKSKLVALVEKEVKRQFEENSGTQVYPEKFLKSEGLKKLLESHTIYRDTERKIKAEVKESTIKRWLREANLKPQSDEENK